MTPPEIAVLDYGISNLHSVTKALDKVGAAVMSTSDPRVAADADGIVLPGVGNFGACMQALRASGLDTVVVDAVAHQRPLLGICVGMQMLFDGSDESPDAAGLGVVPGQVRRIDGDVKLPQMQWNRLTIGPHADPLFDGLGAEPWVYFVHSWHGVPTDPSVIVGTCEYGSTVTAALRTGAVFATQFHPEKSGTVGLKILKNFVEYCYERSLTHDRT